MAKQKLQLNFNEDNEIDFSLKIEGNDPDLGVLKPKIRFTITEAQTGRGWIFGPMKKPENHDRGGIKVVIPDMKGIVNESLAYHGKLEVILGTKYFTPTEVDVLFVEPLKVEAALMGSGVVEREDVPLEQERTSNEQDLTVESQIDSIIVKDPAAGKMLKEAPEKKKKKKQDSLVYSDLSESEQKAVNEIFLKKCEKLGVDSPQKYLKEGTAYTKRRLKALIAASVKEYVKRS
jgi:hypothetical protein